MGLNVHREEREIDVYHKCKLPIDLHLCESGTICTYAEEAVENFHRAGSDTPTEADVHKKREPLFKRQLNHNR